MLDYFVHALRNNPELAIFLTLAVGFVIGRGETRELQPRNRRRLSPGGRSDRPTRHQGPLDREDGLLRPLPLHHRLQGRTAVLSRAERRRAPSGRAHGRSVCHVSAHGVRFREGAGIRRRNSGRAPGRGILGIHSHRHRRRSDPALRPSRCGEAGADQQHSGCVRRDLPHRHRQPCLVPAHHRAEADGNQSQARRRAHAGGDCGQRSAGSPGSSRPRERSTCAHAA